MKKFLLVLLLFGVAQFTKACIISDNCAICTEGKCIFYETKDGPVCLRQNLGQEAYLTKTRKVSRCPTSKNYPTSSRKSEPIIITRKTTVSLLETPQISNKSIIRTDFLPTDKIAASTQFKNLGSEHKNIGHYAELNPGNSAVSTHTSYPNSKHHSIWNSSMEHSLNYSPSDGSVKVQSPNVKPKIPNYSTSRDVNLSNPNQSFIGNTSGRNNKPTPPTTGNASNIKPTNTNNRENVQTSVVLLQKSRETGSNQSFIGNTSGRNNKPPPPTTGNASYIKSTNTNNRETAQTSVVLLQKSRETGSNQSFIGNTSGRNNKPPAPITRNASNIKPANAPSRENIQTFELSYEQNRDFGANQSTIVNTTKSKNKPLTLVSVDASILQFYKTENQNEFRDGSVVNATETSIKSTHATTSKDASNYNVANTATTSSNSALAPSTKNSSVQLENKYTSIIQIAPAITSTVQDSLNQHVELHKTADKIATQSPSELFPSNAVTLLSTPSSADRSSNSDGKVAQIKTTNSERLTVLQCKQFKMMRKMMRKFYKRTRSINGERVLSKCIAMMQQQE